MKLFLFVLCFIGISLCAIDCSESACVLIYEYCEETCHTFDGCCPSCCDEACVECLVSPCQDWACDGHPDFTCRDDYCGGCNRLWFDRNGVRTECENEVQGVGACDQHDCPLVEFCAGCGTVRDGCCEKCCEESCAECLVDPCEGYSCQGYPGYSCQSNFCGGCNRDWINTKGEPVTCPVEIYGEHACASVLCIAVDTSSCDCGLAPTDGCCASCCEGACARCLADPCEGYTCSDNENYRCESNYCEGCNRLWYKENGDRVHCSLETTEAPEDCSEVMCTMIELDCPCGTTTVDCCPACIEEVNCFVDPCHDVTCADNAEYTCESNYCGGCNRDWIDREGNQVECKKEVIGEEDCSEIMCTMIALDCPCGTTTVDCCPACIEEVNCFVDPCHDVTCADNAEYTCESNYCGGCNRDWVDRNGNQVECKREVIGEEDCSEVMCTMIALDCPCGITTVDCCPACIEEEVNCLVDPCQSVSCANHPDFTCEANYCGGCNRDWFDKNGNSVQCERELFDVDWLLDCAKDVDCALQNVDHGFGCCFDGVCDPIDFSRDMWRPVNSKWWKSHHDACSVNCGPEPGCLAIENRNDHFVAICKNAQCVKVNSLLVVPGDDQTDSDNNTPKDSSSGVVLVSIWAFVMALLLAAM